MLISRNCANCGKEYEIQHYKVKDGRGIYCGRKCACSVTGKKSTKPWNKGLTKEDDKRLATIGKYSSKRNIGNIPWNKGLTAQTDERWAEAVKKQTEFRNTESPAKEEWKKALAKGQVKAWSEGKYDNKLTKPELLVWEYLESKGFPVKEYKDRSEDDAENTFYSQYPFYDTFVPDFGCPGLKTVIEVHGCAIHAHDESKCKHEKLKYGWSEWAINNRKRDRRKYSLYSRRRYTWILCWSCEVLNGDFHRIDKYLKGVI